MTIINQAGGVVSTAEELQTKVAIRAAKKEGHKFIQVFYNQEFIQDAEAQPEVRINGVQAIRVYPNRDNKNRLKYDVVVAGGQCVFQFDPEEDEWIGEMLDDKTPGLYGEDGYNRDFLATHLETGEFIIKDGRIRRDIERRLAKIKKINHEKQLKRAEEEVAILPALEEELKRAQEKVDKAREQQKKAQSQEIPSLTLIRSKNPSTDKKEPDAQHPTGS